MTGAEPLAGAAVRYLVCGLRQAGGEVDAGRVLNEDMDALHDLISTRLGEDLALRRLRAEAPTGAVPALTVRRSADAIAQAALDDEGFAAELRRLVGRLDERAAATVPTGGTHNVISGGARYGPVLQGRDFTGAITFGSAVPDARAGGAGRGVPGPMSGPVAPESSEPGHTGDRVSGAVGPVVRESSEPGHTRNQVSGVVIGPAVMGRDITVCLPPRVPTTTSGLPAASPAFTGRRADLEWLLAQLAPPRADAGDGRPAVVAAAVSGLAGVGKTELAVQAAHIALKRKWFPGGVLFADLFGYDDDRRRDTGDVLEGMLGALGMPREHIPAHAHDRSRMFASVLTEFAAEGRRVLVVADNLDARHQAKLLLPADGATAAILTSRHTLGMLNVRLRNLNVLERDDAVAMLDETIRIADPGDTRVPADPDGIAELARICGDLPLALRIVAAMLAEDPDLGPHDLAGQMRATRPLRGLVYEPDGVARAFSLSYRGLTEEQRRMFRLLALNPGPDISSAAAATLVADTVEGAGALTLCRELARAHLIERGGGPGRWRMHDLVRQYAETLTDRNDGDTGGATGRLVAYYLATTWDAVTRLRPAGSGTAGGVFRERDEALEWLDVELPNLSATAHVAAQRHHPLAIALPLCLVDHLRGQGLFNEWITLITLARDTARHVRDRDHEGIASSSLGIALTHVRRFEEAIVALRQAADIFAGTGDRRSEGRALGNLGIALREERRFEEAVAAHQQDLDICREFGDEHGEGQALGNLGSALGRTGRFEDALAAHQRAVAAFAQAGDRQGEGREMANLGSALATLRRFGAAITAHEQGLEICRELGDRHGEGVALNNLGVALREVGRSGEATIVHEQGLEICRELGDRHGEGVTLSNLGLALYGERRFEEAAVAVRSAVQIFVEVGDRYNEKDTRANLEIIQSEER